MTNNNASTPDLPMSGNSMTNNAAVNADFIDTAQRSPASASTLDQTVDTPITNNSITGANHPQNSNMVRTKSDAQVENTSPDPEQTMINNIKRNQCFVSLKRLDDILGITNTSDALMVSNVGGHSLHPRPSREPCLDRHAKYNVVYKSTTEDSSDDNLLSVPK